MRAARAGCNVHCRGLTDDYIVTRRPEDLSVRIPSFGIAKAGMSQEVMQHKIIALILSLYLYIHHVWLMYSVRTFSPTID